MELRALIITDNHYTREEIYQELAGAKARGITPLLTFSAPVLSQEDLADPAGNAILSMADEVGGGVIVSTPCFGTISGPSIPT